MLQVGFDSAGFLDDGFYFDVFPSSLGFNWDQLNRLGLSGGLRFLSLVCFRRTEP
jgi:hypothetical protein